MVRSKSEQTNQLLARCQDAIDGRISEDEARAALDARAQALTVARDSFLTAAARDLEGRELPQDWQPFIDYVVSAFGQVEDALRALRANLRANGAMDALALAADGLLAAIDIYEARGLGEGPSPHAIHNALSTLTERFREKTLPLDPYLATLGATREHFEGCAREMRGAVDQPAESAAQVAEAFDACVAALQAMERGAADADDPSILTLALHQLEGGLARVDSAVKMHQNASFADGPTWNRTVNVYLSAARMLKAGTYPVDQFMADLDVLGQSYARFRQQMEQMAVSGEDEISAILTALDVYAGGIAAFRRYPSTRNTHDIDEGIDQVTHAMAMLDASRNKLESATDLVGKLVCPRCGTPNDPTHRVCGKCSGVLPRMHVDPVQSSFALGEDGRTASDAESPMYITEPMHRFMQETNRFVEEEISAQEYRAAIAAMRTVLRAGDNALMGMTASINEGRLPVDRAAAEEVRAQFAKSLSNVRESMDIFERYAESRDAQLLIDGPKLFWDNFQALGEVRRKMDAWTAPAGGSRKRVGSENTCDIPLDRV